MPTLTQYSLRPDWRLDPLSLSVIRDVDRVMRACVIDYMLVGATARDILLTGVFGMDASRATLDVDYAIAIRTWVEFEEIKKSLVATGHFEAHADNAHKLRHIGSGSGPSYPVDIIPFGGIEQPRSSVTLPQNPDSIINVAGFDDALASAPFVTLEPALTVRVVSLPAMAILKILAWDDRGQRIVGKDVGDLVGLMRAYVKLDGGDRLYGADNAHFDAVDNDEDLASPRLLGLDAGRLASTATKKALGRVLDDEGRIIRLTLDMATQLRGRLDPDGDAARMLEQFKIGLNWAD